VETGTHFKESLGFVRLYPFPATLYIVERSDWKVQSIPGLHGNISLLS
jgi:hypothetical protein